MGKPLLAMTSKTGEHVIIEKVLLDHSISTEKHYRNVVARTTDLYGEPRANGLMQTRAGTMGFIAHESKAEGITYFEAFLIRDKTEYDFNGDFRTARFAKDWPQILEAVKSIELGK